jgi:2'-5' RNA ligase
MNCDTVRTFVAVEIGEEVRAAARRFRDRAGGRLPGARWVAAENLHLTLAFLGEVAPDLLSRARQVLDEAVSDFAPFAFEVVGIGFFGSARDPRVLWAGLSGDVLTLAKLQARVAAGLRGRGFSPEERAFSPHLTLARFRRGRPAGEAARIATQHRDLRFGTAIANRLLLMRSDLGPQGPRYAILHEALLVRPPEGRRDLPPGSG